MLTGVIQALAALLVIFLAYLIKYKKKVNIISGYDEQTCKDKDGLANWVGGTLIIAGSIAFIVALCAFVLPNYIGAIVVIYGTTIITGAMIAAIGGNKFKV